MSSATSGAKSRAFSPGIDAVAVAPTLAALTQAVGALRERTDERERRSENVVGVGAEQLTHDIRDTGRVVGDLGGGQPRVDLDVVEAFARTFPQPRDLLVDALGHRVVRGIGVDLTGVDRRVDTHDVGDRSGEAQHARLAAADDEGRAADRVRARRARQIGDAEVLARERDGLSRRTAPSGSSCTRSSGRRAPWARPSGCRSGRSRASSNPRRARPRAGLPTTRRSTRAHARAPRDGGSRSRTRARRPSASS